MCDWHTVLICGSRSWTDEGRIREVLEDLVARNSKCCEDLRIIHGGAKGADLIAARIAKELKVLSIKEFRPDWAKHGKSAGILRNLTMLLEGEPDEVIAFWDGRSTGTAHMVHEASKVRVPVRVVMAAAAVKESA